METTRRQVVNGMMAGSIFSFLPAKECSAAPLLGAVNKLPFEDFVGPGNPYRMVALEPSKYFPLPEPGNRIIQVRILPTQRPDTLQNGFVQLIKLDPRLDNPPEPEDKPFIDHNNFVNIEPIPVVDREGQERFVRYVLRNCLTHTVYALIRKDFSA